MYMLLLERLSRADVSCPSLNAHLLGKVHPGTIRSQVLPNAFHDPGYGSDSEQSTIDDEQSITDDGHDEAGPR